MTTRSSIHRRRSLVAFLASALLLVASANPEDYTNRGRLITPLKDRFGSQIRTHYPLDVDTEVGGDDVSEPFGVVGDHTVEIDAEDERTCHGSSVPQCDDA